MDQVESRERITYHLHPSFHRTPGLEIDSFIPVLVGTPLYTVFYIHKETLCAASPFFKTHIKPIDKTDFGPCYYYLWDYFHADRFGKQPECEGFLALDREDPVVFGGFLQWLYLGESVLARQEGEDAADQYDRLWDLGEMAYRFRVWRLQHQVVCILFGMGVRAVMKWCRGPF